MFWYKVYGLRLCCTHQLSHLLSQSSDLSSAFDVTADLSNQLPTQLSSIADWQAIAPSTQPHTEATLWHSEHWYRLRYSRDAHSALTFYLSKDGSHVYSQKPDTIPFSDIESFLIGPILGYVRCLQGLTNLHASVLSYQKKAFALLGGKGAGKSTTASALLTLGAQLVADDLATLDNDQNQVYPGYPATRLTAQALHSYSIQHNTCLPVTSVANKYYVNLPHSQTSWQFDQHQRPLSCLYVLEARQKTLNSTKIQRLSGGASLIAVSPHRYPVHQLDKAHTQQSFVRIAQLSQDVIVKSVQCPDNIHQLNTIATHILDDFKQTINNSAA